MSDAALIALGGNALLRRGEPLEAGNELRAAGLAARQLAAVATSRQLVVTHGNGPQIGLLALMSEAYGEAPPYPLDVLGSETEGQIGYLLELELANAGVAHTVALLTRVVVDAYDPAFAEPSKFIGPVYSAGDAVALRERHGWVLERDGDAWRRVVASPEPRRIVQLDAIRCLTEQGFLVVCAGGGGIPVIESGPGVHCGVEAVIDKDLASALLAAELGVDTLVLATDVQAVYADYGTRRQRALGHVTPDVLRAMDFPAGSMGPKVEAVCRFVEGTGGRAVIGGLQELEALLEGSAGTQVTADRTLQTNPERKASHDLTA